MKSYETSPNLQVSTKDVITQLEQGPGLVKNPAAQDILSSDEALDYFNHRMLGNFSGYFASPTSLIGSVYRQTKCRQRFAILYPELTEQLESRVAMGATTVSPPDGTVDERFIEAYELMRPLVDRGDPKVINSQTGEVDDWYLLH